MKLLLSAILFLFVCSCGPNPSKNSLGSTTPAKINTPTETITSVDTTHKEPVTKWEYREDEDKMTSRRIKFASISANELLYFDFPYNGGSTANITIRKKDGGTDVYLRVSQGQFHSSYDGGYIRIRFDENPPKKYSFSGASDGSSDIIFIDAAKDFIVKAKASKRMIIEAEFYNNGLHQMEFDIEGLKWDK